MVCGKVSSPLPACVSTACSQRKPTAVFRHTSSTIWFVSKPPAWVCFCMWTPAALGPAPCWHAAPCTAPAPCPVVHRALSAQPAGGHFPCSQRTGTHPAAHSTAGDPGDMQVLPPAACSSPGGSQPLGTAHRWVGKLLPSSRCFVPFLPGRRGQFHCFP